MEGKLDREMKNKLHKEEAQRENLKAFLWVKLMTATDACACAAPQCMCSEMEGENGSFGRPPTPTHPTSINYTQLLSIHQDQEVPALKRLKAIG